MHVSFCAQTRCGQKAGGVLFHEERSHVLPLGQTYLVLDEELDTLDGRGSGLGDSG